MSIRAYKVIEIKQEKYPMFSVSEEFNWIIEHSNWQAWTNDNELYMIEFEKEQLEEAIKKEKDKNKKEILRSIIKEIPKNDYYISYICY